MQKCVNVTEIVLICWFQNPQALELDVLDSSVSKLDFIKDGSVVQYNTVVIHFLLNAFVLSMC